MQHCHFDRFTIKCGWFTNMDVPFWYLLLSSLGLPVTSITRITTTTGFRPTTADSTPLQEMHL